MEEIRCQCKETSKSSLEMVCVSKEEGGLGVIDIEKQNKALLTKNLHKFYSKEDLPWVKTHLGKITGMENSQITLEMALFGERIL